MDNIIEIFDLISEIHIKNHAGPKFSKDDIFHATKGFRFDKVLQLLIHW